MLSQVCSYIELTPQRPERKNLKGLISKISKIPGPRIVYVWSELQTPVF